MLSYCWWNVKEIAFTTLENKVPRKSMGLDAASITVARFHSDWKFSFPVCTCSYTCRSLNMRLRK